MVLGWVLISVGVEPVHYWQILYNSNRQCRAWKLWVEKNDQQEIPMPLTKEEGKDLKEGRRVVYERMWRKNMERENDAFIL